MNSDYKLARVFQFFANYFALQLFLFASRCHDALGMERLEDLVKECLETDELTQIGYGSGCISDGVGYKTGNGREVFVKVNRTSDVRFS